MSHSSALKTDSLQYNMLVRWLARTNDLSTKRLMFQAFIFFQDLWQNSLQKSFQYFFFIFYNFTKMKFKSLSALSLSEIVKKNNKTLGPACYIEDCQISDAWTWTWQYSTLFTFRILYEFVMSVHLLCTLLTYPYCSKHVHAGFLILDCTFWEIR